MSRRSGWALLLVVSIFNGRIWAGDWPMFGHDNHRSAVADEGLKLPLSLCWTFEAGQGPEPAWPPPAKQDYWHRLSNLKPAVNYDRAFHVVGRGEVVFFGSSADCKVYALDALSGRLRWSFFTDGPVRLAPVAAGPRVYAASDDGCVYCLSATDGSLVWKFRAAEDRRFLPGNGRMISAQPIRAGLVLDAGTLYFAAGIFPSYGVFLYALNAEDGSVRWKQRIEVSAQGYILASADRLYVPTGRTSPCIFSRTDGRFLGELPSGGGTYAVLNEDILLTGPGRGARRIKADDSRTRDTVATFAGLRMVVRGTTAFLQSQSELCAFDRGRYIRLARQKNELEQRRKKRAEQLKKAQKGSAHEAQLRQEIEEMGARLGAIGREMKACYLWTVPCEYSCSMIAAGDMVFVGGQDRVAAIDSSKGQVAWSAAVAGRAYGLSVVNGRLYVSTDRGRIHCFGNGCDNGGVTRAGGAWANLPGEDELTAVYAEAAKYIAGRSGINKGYCLVLDCGQGRLALELGRLTELNIIGVESDGIKAAAARKRLDEVGLYGRVVVHQVGAEQLPYTKYSMNLVVSDGALRTGRLSGSAKDILGLLRPCGGTIILGVPAAKTPGRRLEKWGQGAGLKWDFERAGPVLWASASRGALEGAGQWTHTYGDPGNSACSGETLVSRPVALQWFGRPGPERMIDRHHRNVPPLYKDGRLFVPGDCIVYAVDAYNGTSLWEREIPNSRRLGVFLDSGSMAVDSRFLYVVAEDKCYGFDVETGTRCVVHTMPQVIEDAKREWGYIAYSGDVLIGSGRRAGASYTETSYEADDALWHRGMKVVSSDYLFALDKTGGERLWTYKAGLVVNPTIAVGDGRVYFVETTSPAALADELGRMAVSRLFDGGQQYLTALEVETGEKVFRKQIDVSNFAEPVYLNYAEGVLLLSGPNVVDRAIHYYYDAFDAQSGEVLWRVSHRTSLDLGGGHGEYNRHPTIIGDTVYAWPYAYRLKTGERIESWRMERRGHGCGGVSASARCLFWRGGNPWMYDLGPGGGPVRLTSVTRPGCWINIVPAGGLVLIPEASSGCTCGFSVQGSLALIPTAALQ